MAILDLFLSREKKEQREKEASNKRLQKERLEYLGRYEDFCKKMSLEFGYLDLEKLKSHTDFKMWVNLGSIHIKKTDVHRETIKRILKQVPGAFVEQDYPNIRQIEIGFNSTEYANGALKKVKSPVYRPLYFISGEIKEAIKQNLETYNVLLYKYDDIFQSIWQTVSQMKEEGKLTEKAEETIGKVLMNFVEEFLSLRNALRRADDMKRKALTASLQERLEDELKLSEGRKTDWSKDVTQL